MTLKTVNISFWRGLGFRKWGKGTEMCAIAKTTGTCVERKGVAGLELYRKRNLSLEGGTRTGGQIVTHN